MYGLECTVEPTTEPCTVEELKSHLRINTNDEDDLLEGFIVSARQTFEFATGRQLFTATFKMYLNKWYYPIRVPKSPLASVTSIKYYDNEEVLQTWSSSNYTVDVKRQPGVIHLNWGTSFPVLSLDVKPAIIIEFVAGRSVCDTLIKQGVLLLAGDFYKRRETLVEGSLADLPFGFRSICDRYRVGWIHGEQ